MTETLAGFTIATSSTPRWWWEDGGEETHLVSHRLDHRLYGEPAAATSPVAARPVAVEPAAR